MRKIITFVILTLGYLPSVWAQANREEIPRSLNEGTLFGAGTSHVKDTYISPFNYSGFGLRILNERMKTVSLMNYRVSRQQLISVDISSTQNPAEKVNDFGGFVDYSLGYHYRIPVSSNLKWLVGTSGHLLAGFIYNTRNSNNPLSAKIDLDINFSTLLIYSQKIRNLPLTFRYQLDLPLMGVFFSPPYGESYYEIFNVGNTSNIVSFNSFHNKFSIRNYLTVDIPVRDFVIRTGYLNSYYYSDTNDVETRIVSNSFMIGWVKEFISLGGKRLKKKKNINSPYY